MGKDIPLAAVTCRKDISFPKAVTLRPFHERPDFIRCSAIYPKHKVYVITPGPYLVRLRIRHLCVWVVPEDTLSDKHSELILYRTFIEYRLALFALLFWFFFWLCRRVRALLGRNIIYCYCYITVPVPVLV